MLAPSALGDTSLGDDSNDDLDFTKGELLPRKGFEMNVAKSEIQFEEEIGVGASGLVRLATWKGRKVAAKIMTYTCNEDRVAFMKEVCSLSRISHPNLLEAYGCCIEEDGVILITEFIKCGSLRDYLDGGVDKDSQTLSPLFFRIVIDVVTGIRYLHAHGIVHRDLKPSNVLLNSFDARSHVVAIICDFGVAREVSNKMTVRAGTLRYMAPEVYSGTYTQAVDIYSFGIMLCELVSRAMPFEGMEWDFAVSEAVLEGRRPPIPLNCPKDLAILIKGCWNQNANLRPSANRVFELLHSIAACRRDPRRWGNMSQEEGPLSPSLMKTQSEPEGEPEKTGSKRIRAKRDIPRKSRPPRLKGFDSNEDKQMEVGGKSMRYVLSEELPTSAGGLCNGLSGTPQPGRTNREPSCEKKPRRLSFALGSFGSFGVLHTSDDHSPNQPRLLRRIWKTFVGSFGTAEPTSPPTPPTPPRTTSGPSLSRAHHTEPVSPLTSSPPLQPTTTPPLQTVSVSPLASSPPAQTCSLQTSQSVLSAAMNTIEHHSSIQDLHTDTNFLKRRNSQDIRALHKSMPLNDSRDSFKAAKIQSRLVRSSTNEGPIHIPRSSLGEHINRLISQQTGRGSHRNKSISEEKKILKACPTVTFVQMDRMFENVEPFFFSTAVIFVTGPFENMTIACKSYLRSSDESLAEIVNNAMAYRAHPACQYHPPFLGMFTSEFNGVGLTFGPVNGYVPLSQVYASMSEAALPSAVCSLCQMVEETLSLPCHSYFLECNSVFVDFNEIACHCIMGYPTGCSVDIDVALESSMLPFLAPELLSRRFPLRLMDQQACLVYSVGVLIWMLFSGMDPLEYLLASLPSRSCTGSKTQTFETLGFNILHMNLRMNSSSDALVRAPYSLRRPLRKLISECLKHEPNKRTTLGKVKAFFTAFESGGGGGGLCV